MDADETLLVWRVGVHASMHRITFLRTFLLGELGISMENVGQGTQKVGSSDVPEKPSSRLPRVKTRCDWEADFKGLVCLNSITKDFKSTWKPSWQHSTGLGTNKAPDLINGEKGRAWSQVKSDKNKCLVTLPKINVLYTFFLHSIRIVWQHQLLFRLNPECRHGTPSAQGISDVRW